MFPRTLALHELSLALRSLGCIMLYLGRSGCAGHGDRAIDSGAWGV